MGTAQAYTWRRTLNEEKNPKSVAVSGSQKRRRDKQTKMLQKMVERQEKILKG